MSDPDALRLDWVERMAGVYDDEPDEDDLLDEDDDTWKEWDEP